MAGRRCFLFQEEDNKSNREAIIFMSKTPVCTDHAFTRLAQFERDLTSWKLHGHRDGPAVINMIKPFLSKCGLE